MAKPRGAAQRWTSVATAYLFPRGGDTLWYLIAIVSIFSLLTHELSRRSALAADFEGFDAEEEEEEFLIHHADLFPTTPLSPIPTTPSESTPESHHGPPSSLEASPDTVDQSPPAEPTPTDAAQASVFEEWDEDEFEGIPVHIPEASHSPVAEDLSPDAAPPKPTAAAVPASFPRSYGVEIACVSFLIAFVINYFTGKKENENMALAWASRFATKETIFDKNFSLLGTGDGKGTPLLLKEARNVFKFYASGRRFCQGLLATMELRPRHDLIAKIVDLLFPKKDTITFEVVMNDDAMDQVVFAVAKKKLAKAMQKEERDLQRYATLVTPPVGRKWLPEDLAVVSESKEVAADLVTDAVLDQVFGDKAFEKFGKGFISLHFSDQHPGSHKKMLVFKFALPDAKNMTEMTRLVSLIPYYIDLIGRYKLSSQARAKTEAVRAKAAQEAYRELQNARQEALQRRKAERKKLLESEAKLLNVEAIRKKEEKERARQMKKGMPRVKMLRGH